MEPPDHPLTDREFRDIYSRVPRLCVDLVLADSRGILLTKRHAYSYVGQWHVPGGTVLYREPLADAVVRIGRGELGMTLTPIRQLGTIEYRSEERERGFGYSVGVVFLCRFIEDPKPPPGQSEETGFFTVLPEPMITEQRAFLDRPDVRRVIGR